jgi:hypothetical protein
MDVRADCNHFTRGFDPEAAGKVDRIGAVAVIDVDIVEATAVCRDNAGPDPGARASPRASR